MADENTNDDGDQNDIPLRDPVQEQQEQAQEDLSHALQMLGIAQVEHRNRLINDCFPRGLVDFQTLGENDIESLVSSYASRRIAADRINLGLAIQRRLKGLMHYVQDCYRVDRDPNHLEVDIPVVEAALQRSIIRKSFCSQRETNAKAADPGKFIPKKWHQWENAFDNYLSVLPGSTGIPLAYIIRKEENVNEPLGGWANFHLEMIAKAPLHGNIFHEDARTVYQLITSFTNGTAAEEYIKAGFPRGRCHNNGRLAFQSLRSHYGGVGYLSRRIARAESLEASLFYKNESTFNFESFSSRIEEMFNIYKEENQEKTDEEKIRILFRKIQSSSLVHAVASLRVTQTTQGLTYDQAINHLATIVGTITKPNRRVAQMKTSKPKRPVRRHSNYIDKATWNKMTKEEKRKVIDARKKKSSPSNNRPGNTSAINATATNNEDASSVIGNAILSVISGVSRENNDTNSIATQNNQPVTELNVETQDTPMGFGGRNVAIRRKNNRTNSQIISSIRIGQHSIQPVTCMSKVCSTSTCEMDSHADTCVLDCNFSPIYFTGRKCSVCAYNDDYDPIDNIPIAAGTTAYDDPYDGNTYILVIHEGLYFGEKMRHSLLNPNQLRHYGTVVDDNPYHQDGMMVQTEEITIPLTSYGTDILFTTRTPTAYELENCKHIDLTSGSIEWDPNHISFPNGSPRTNEYDGGSTIISMAARTDDLSKIHRSRNDLDFLKKLNEMESNSNIDIPTPRTFVSSDRHSVVSAKDLSEKWMISQKHAEKTIKATTQRGIRSAVLPLSRRYRGDLFYQKKRLNSHFYSDTYFARTKSLHGNTCAQVFGNRDQFVDVYPMSTKSHAGNALKQFISDWGVPSELTFDNAWEQTKPGSEFMKIITKHDIKWHTSEPYRPDQNAAESIIREVRKKWFRLMARKNVPTDVWDYGLKWVCEIQ